MYLFNDNNLEIENILDIYKKEQDDKELNSYKLINSIKCNNINNFKAFLILYKEANLEFSNFDLRSIYYAVVKKDNFQYYTDELYANNIKPYISDNKRDNFLDFFYNEHKIFCQYLHTKGYPKTMKGFESPANYALINCDFDLFKNILSENYEIDYKIAMVSLIIARFPKNEKEITGYIETLEHILKNISSEDLKKEYKDKAYTKLFLFTDIKLEQIIQFDEKLSDLQFSINFNIYEDNYHSSILEHLSENLNLVSYLYKKHHKEENVQNNKNKLFNIIIKHNEYNFKDIENIYNLFEMQISDDEASFLFNDFINKPEFIKFLISKNYEFPIDYSFLKRDVIQRVTSSPEHFDSMYNYYTNEKILKSLYEICLKEDFNPNFQYVIDYYEKDREKKNFVNVLEIFINNDSDGKMIERLINLDKFNYTQNLFHTFLKYYNREKLEHYCDINYYNIHKSGFKIEKEALIKMAKSIENEDDLKLKIISLHEKSLINSSLKINDIGNKKIKRI